MLTYRFFRALFSLFFLYNSYSVQGLAWCLECFLYSPRRQYFRFFITRLLSLTPIVGTRIVKTVI